MARSSESSGTLPGVLIPHLWQAAADTIAYDSSTRPPPVAFVCGPGNSGKSVFSRLLLNTLLKRYKRVGYMETDLGQPEFTPPGFISLHIFDKQTPDLTMLCLKTPERGFYYGDVTSIKEPAAYLNNIFSLYDYFVKEYYQAVEVDNPVVPMLPLVINTGGWVKGVGFDLLVKMLRYTVPTHVVQVRVSAESKNLPTGLFWLDGEQNTQVNTIEIAAAPKASFNRTRPVQQEAHTMRDLRIIAYFRQCLSRDLDISSHEEFTGVLASIPPYEVPIARIKARHLFSQDQDGGTCHSLKAKIVGLAISSSPDSASEHRSSCCIGLGIVRDVDVSKGLLYMITPVPECSLKKVNLLLQGAIGVPNCLLQGLPSSLLLLRKVEPPKMDSEEAAMVRKQFSQLL